MKEVPFLHTISEKYDFENLWESKIIPIPRFYTLVYNSPIVMGFFVSFYYFCIASHIEMSGFF